MSDCNFNCSSCKVKCESKSLLVKPNINSSVKKVIAVASGKGGVGKSLVTSLLAILLRQKGYNTAILDGDVTGPSIPKIFGVSGGLFGTKHGLLPKESKTGIKLVSSNFLLKEETDPVLWRGPIITGLLKQFWSEIIWADVDFMFVDMPPGTGDVPLTVYQSLPIDGIIIVTTPQELVSMIVSKAVKMAQKMNIPVLGIIENMSYVQCDKCNHQIKVFGESNVDKIAEDFNIEVLAKMPLDPQIAQLCDCGELENISIDYLEGALMKLENLPIEESIIAVPVEGENIHEHMVHASSFNIYKVVKDMIISGKRVDVDGRGLDAILNTFKVNNVDTVLVKQIGDHILEILNDVDISVYPCAPGNALASMQAFLSDRPEEILVGNCGCGGHEHDEDEHDCDCDDDCDCNDHDCDCK